MNLLKVMWQLFLKLNSAKKRYRDCESKSELMHVVASPPPDSHKISDAVIGGSPSIFTLICSKEA